MKSTHRLLAGTLAAVVVLAACSSGDTTGVESTVDDATATVASQAEETTGTTMSEETDEAVAKLQTSLDVVTSELESAQLDADLMAAWDEIQVRATSAIASAEASGSLDTQGIETTLDEFESTLTTQNVEPTVIDAWTEFRLSFESFLSQFATSG